MLLVGETGLMGPATAEQINTAALWIDQAAAPTTRPAPSPSTAPSTAPATRPAGGVSPPAPEAEVQLARGMLAYRRAKFEAAIEYLRRCRAALEKAQASADSNEVERLAEQHATAGFFLAMAAYQLSRTPEARQALTQARQELETDVPSPFSADPQVGTPEWLIAHIAARQAADLIDPASLTINPATSRAAKSR